jgi:hypothetical protein
MAITKHHLAVFTYQIALLITIGSRGSWQIYPPRPRRSMPRSRGWSGLAGCSQSLPATSSIISAWRRWILSNGEVRYGLRGRAQPYERKRAQADFTSLGCLVCRGSAVDSRVGRFPFRIKYNLFFLYRHVWTHNHLHELSTMHSRQAGAARSGRVE